MRVTAGLVGFAVQDICYFANRIALSCNSPSVRPVTLRGGKPADKGIWHFPLWCDRLATTSCVRVVQCHQLLQPSAHLGARPADSTRPYAGAWPAWTTSTSMVRMTRTMTSATGSARCSARRLSITGWHRLCGQPELRRLLPEPRRTFGCARPCPASATQPR